MVNGSYWSRGGAWGAMISDGLRWFPMICVEYQKLPTLKLYGVLHAEIAFDPPGFAMSLLWDRPCRVPPVKCDMQKTCRNIGWIASWTCSWSSKYAFESPKVTLKGAPGRQRVAYVATFRRTATCKFPWKNKVRAALAAPGDFYKLCSAYFWLAWSASWLCFHARASKSTLQTRDADLVDK